MDNTIIHDWEYIVTPPKPGADGVGLSDGKHHIFTNCMIDLSDVPVAEMDEALGITWGSSATFKNCIVKGAGKLILCGCGDDPSRPEVQAEVGKVVRFEDCTLFDFCRRGPEVQDGMTAILERCLIMRWGLPSRFCDDGFRGWLRLPWKQKWQRAFGAWAHRGGFIKATDCAFIPLKYKAPLWQRIVSRIGHMGQALAERGLLGLFHRDFWLSGYRRALTAGPGGEVFAEHCFAADGCVIDNHVSPMTEEEFVQGLLADRCVSDGFIMTQLHNDGAKEAVAWAAYMAWAKERLGK